MIIYVSGPLSAPNEYDRVQNIENAMEAGYRLLVIGHAPVIPHLSIFLEEYIGPGKLAYEEYVAWDLELLARCDAILCLGSSPGADTERAFAECHGIPIYEHVTEIPPADTVKVLRPVTCGEVAGGSGGGQRC